MEAELWVFRVEEGLGNACALIFPDGSGGIIDWGTQRPDPRDVLWNLLSRRQQPHLRFVVATHAHSDHTLGIESLIADLTTRGVKIDRFFFPTPLGRPSEDHLFRARRRAYKLGIKLHSIQVSTLPGSPPAPIIASDAARQWIVRVIAPNDSAIGKAEVQAQNAAITPGNATSLVLQFAFLHKEVTLERGRAILPGDATPATLNEARRRSEEFRELTLVNDALVIPHHGSKHNWIPWFADVIRGVALISAPSGRPKHPSEVVLKSVVRICGKGQNSQLFCNSFAGTCHASFVEGLSTREATT